MYSRGNMLGSMGHADGYDVGSKRQRISDDDGYYRSSSAGRSTSSGMGYGGLSRVFPVVRLRGLPYDCREIDIYGFFGGLDIVDILLVHKGGRFSGEAYVVFAFAMQVDFALQCNRRNMGHRYVEVFRSKKQDYYLAVAAEVADSKSYYEEPSTKAHLQPVKTVSHQKDFSPEHTGVLRLRGLPFSVTKSDIIEFFGHAGLLEDNIHIVTQADGRATGEAFVEFSGPEASKDAMKKDKMTLGSRYIELFPSSREEATRAALKSHHR